MSTRTVASINVAGVEPATIESDPPHFHWVDPTALLVDGAYQRNLSERSVTLIRKIVGSWDWAKFKPPVCASTDGGLEVIDGQHTAIAAASHPGVTQIPVMIVHAAAQQDRASAFVAHNKDRLGITQGQMHYAAVAAGDEDALTIAQVCERAGVTILRGPPANGVYKPGDSVALVSIGALINRRGAMKARIVLQALAQARCAPVGAQLIKAADVLMHDAEYAGTIAPEDITNAVQSLGVDGIEQEARVFAHTHKVPVWRGMAVTIFRKARHGRRRPS